MGNSSVNMGDIVQFGGYGWRVLDVRDGKALFLSDKILAKKAYHTKNAEITWEKCDLRKDLNGPFYDKTFTPEEKARIAEIKLWHKDNPWFGTAGGEPTSDKVFLLSLEDAVEYFGYNGWLLKRPDNAFFIDDEYNEARIARFAGNNQPEAWWLRSPGLDGFAAARIASNGRIFVEGADITGATTGVRPALWLNL